MDYDKADRQLAQLKSGGTLTEEQSQTFIDYVMMGMQCKKCERFVTTWWKRLWHRIVCGKPVTAVLTRDMIEKCIESMPEERR
jgi:hypothetical protein